MGEVITQSAIGEQGRHMVRETAKETEADGGHRQRINDFITGLDRTAAFVHELAQAALKSKGSQQDNKEIADKSGSLLSEVSKTRDRVYVEETVGHRNNWFRRAAVMTILRLERDAKPTNFRRHNEQELLKLEADVEVLEAQAKSLKRTNRASQERHAVGIKAKEEAIESMMQEQHQMSVDLASKDCIIQDLETAVGRGKQELVTMEKRWNDTQGRLNSVSVSTDQATHKDESFTAQEMESPMAASVSSQLSKLIQMQEASSITEAVRVKELQTDLSSEKEKRVNAESQLEAVQQDCESTGIALEELIKQLETVNKDYISATEELAISHIKLNESQRTQAEVEQRMMRREQETKSELSTAEEAVTRLEAQLEVEFERLTEMDNALAKSQRQIEDEADANNEVQTQLEKDHKRRENSLRRELELQVEDRVKDVQSKYENLTASQRSLNQAREQQTNEELCNANQTIVQYQEGAALIRKELEESRSELRRIQEEKEQMEQDTSRERSKHSRDIRRLQDEKEELEAKVMRVEVETKYHRGRTANQVGFATRSQKHSGSMNSGTPPQRNASHSRNMNSSTLTQRSTNNRSQSNTSIRRHRPNMNQQQAYASTEQMRPYLTWLVCNDAQGETWVSGFILAARDDVQVAEFVEDERGITQCQFREYEQNEFEAELQSGVLSAQTEADLVLCEEATPVSTLDEMEELKSICRTWLDSDHAQHSGFQGEEYKELRMYVENEAIVHDISSGEVVYVRERIQSTTHRNPGIVQEDGTVFLIHLENSPRNVEPKEVFHIVSECSSGCGSTAFSKSMSRTLSSSRSSTKTGTKVCSKSDQSEQHIDQIALQKYWNALMYSFAPSSEWTKRSLAAADGTNKQGKHFGLMRNVYSNLMAQKQNEEYVLYMVNQMTACNHIAQTTIDTFEKEANGTILRTKNQMTMQDAIDELFLGITGQDMASLGLQAHRVEWDLLT
jgi:hypothetical protein